MIPSQKQNQVAELVYKFLHHPNQLFINMLTVTTQSTDLHSVALLLYCNMLAFAADINSDMECSLSQAVINVFLGTVLPMFEAETDGSSYSWNNS